MWDIEYYQSDTGVCSVGEFIDSLDAKGQARAIHALELLEEFGTGLGMPYVKHLEKHTWELRVHQNKSVNRIIYFVNIEKTIILLRAFARIRYSSST